MLLRKESGGRCWNVSFALLLFAARQGAPPRSQSPQPPFPYQQREASYTNVADKTMLSGTLTIPAGNGRHPAEMMQSEETFSPQALEIITAWVRARAKLAP